MGLDREWKTRVVEKQLPEEEQRVEKNWPFLTRRNSNSPNPRPSYSDIKPLGLAKEERLSSKSKIKTLFEKGRSFRSTHLKCVFLIKELEPNKNQIHQVLISVPKKLLPKAVDRNRRKRQLREAYRLNKAILYNQFENKNKYCTFIFIYLSNKALHFNTMQEEVRYLLNKIKDA